MTRARTIAVALHDVEPATFERCALIRDWLSDHGIEHVTLLVIPARDLHPFDDRRPELAVWLDERARCGDAIAQHGFEHLQRRKAGFTRQAVARLQGARAAEFIGLDPTETRRAVAAGRRLLKLAGVEPRGFVAPAYAYTPALRETLSGSFDWWAGLLQVHRGARSANRFAHAALTPVVGLGTSGPFKRALSPSLIRAAGLVGTRNLRVDLHPADLAYPRHMLALEWVLCHNHRRAAVTYDELAAG